MVEPNRAARARRPRVHGLGRGRDDRVSAASGHIDYVFPLRPDSAPALVDTPFLRQASHADLARRRPGQNGLLESNHPGQALAALLPPRSSAAPEHPRHSTTTRRALAPARPTPRRTPDRASPLW